MTTAITNDRLKQRFDKWDVNGDGVLEKTDFEREADRVTKAFGVGGNSAEAKALKKALIDLYQYHVDQAGTGPNGKITEQQFIQINEHLMQQGESNFNRVLRPTMQALIGMCDSDHDGQINQSEFTNWLKGIGVNGAKASSVFKQIDTNADGQLSVEELLAAVRNFHYGKLDVSMLG